MNIESIKKEECCGCTGCLSVCPKKAITMLPDEEGFLYPKVDSTMCVDCGMCKTVCDEKKSVRKPTIISYAAKNIIDEVLRLSSSGGVSHALCTEVIRRNGVVYGVAYTEDYQVVITRADVLKKCDQFYGSKYVQANPLSTFNAVKNDLINGRTVLYFGTSCYIAGLLSYLKTVRVDTKNLYTVDLICHGVPSPKLFDDYIHWLGNNMKQFEFRTKNKPWGYGSKNFGCTITYKDDKQQIDTVKSRVFLQLFFSNNCLRPHCHYCNFCGVDKPADITIADYWGCKDEEPSFFSERGVSAVLVHSKKGNELLLAATELNLLESNTDKIKKKQGNLLRPSPVVETRDDFWALYQRKGFVAVAKKYGDYTLKAYIRRSKFFYKIFYKQ